jgi:hypothetical protein
MSAAQPAADDERAAMLADPDTLFSRATDQVSADLNGDMAILNLQTKTYFGLTGVGAFIWQKLEKPTDIAALTQAIAEQFQVEQAQCAVDAAAFLDKLASLGLLKIQSGLD